jgi:phage terminase Nu1 subunit (DNA packaging protein)
MCPQSICFLGISQMLIYISYKEDMEVLYAIETARISAKTADTQAIKNRGCFWKLVSLANFCNQCKC